MQTATDMRFLMIYQKQIAQDCQFDPIQSQINNRVLCITATFMAGFSLSFGITDHLILQHKKHKNQLGQKLILKGLKMSEIVVFNFANCKLCPQSEKHVQRSSIPVGGPEILTASDRAWQTQTRAEINFPF